MPFDPSSLTVEALRDEHMRQSDHEVEKVIGRYNGTMVTTHYVHGWSSALPTSGDQPTLVSSELTGATAFHHIMNALGSALGNVSLNAAAIEDGVTVTAIGAPTDTIAVTDAGAGLSNFAAGEAIAWATADAKLTHYINWLTSLDTVAASPDEGDLLQTTPPFDPQGTAVWGGYNIFMPSTLDMDPYHDGACKSWTLKLFGHNSDNQYKCYGCQPIGVKFTFPIGAQPTMEITWGVAHWEAVGSGGEPSVGTYSFPTQESALSWYAAWGDTAADSLMLKNLEFDFGITRNPIEDGAAQSGVGGWYTAKRTPTLSMMVMRDYAQEITLFEGQTAEHFTFQHGSRPGKMFGLCLPNAMVSEWPGPADDDGKRMSNVVLTPTRYTGDSGGAEAKTTPYNSDCRLVFL
jgi:hypothetical protein